MSLSLVLVRTVTFANSRQSLTYKFPDILSTQQLVSFDSRPKNPTKEWEDEFITQVQKLGNADGIALVGVLIKLPGSPRIDVMPERITLTYSGGGDLSIREQILAASIAHAWSLIDVHIFPGEGETENSVTTYP